MCFLAICNNTDKLLLVLDAYSPIAFSQESNPIKFYRWEKPKNLYPLRERSPYFRDRELGGSLKVF